MALFDSFLDAAGYFPSVHAEVLGNAQLSASLLREADNTVRRLKRQFELKPTLARNAVAHACNIGRWEDFHEHVHKLAATPFTQQAARDYFCNAFPLLAVDVPTGLLSRAITHTEEFFQRMSEKSGVPVAALKGMMVARWSSDLPPTAETFDRVLRHGLQRVAPRVPRKTTGTEGYADYSIFVSVNAVLSREMAGLLPSDEDKQYTRGVLDAVRAAVTPLIPEHVASLKAILDNAPGYRPFHYEDMITGQPNAAPEVSQIIGGFGLPTDALVSWAYWAATEGVPESSGLVPLSKFVRRAPGHLKSLRASPLRAPMKCPACGQLAEVSVAMIPSAVHSGDFEMTCFCGHVEKRDASSRRDIGWHRKLTWLQCQCGTCRPARDRLKKTLEASQKGLASRVVREVEAFAGKVLDAQAGRNGLRLTDEGLVDDGGVVLGQWTERRVLPRYTPGHDALGQKINERTLERLPVTGMLVTEEGFTRRFYPSPVARENIAAITAPPPQLRIFMEGFTDDASFLVWASTFISLANEYFLPVPIHVAAWKGKVPPPWLEEALNS